MHIQCKKIVDQTICLSLKFTVRRDATWRISRYFARIFGLLLWKKKRKQSRIRFRCIMGACLQRSKNIGRGIFCSLCCRKFSDSILHAACPIGKEGRLNILVLATSSVEPPVRSSVRSVPSVRVSSVTEVECFATVATVKSSGVLITYQLKH